MFRNDERLLVVAAHPDDEVLGCGGSIARCLDTGAAVRVIFLAEGISARYTPEEFDNPDVVAAIKRRNDNAFRALAILGVPDEEIFVEDRYCCRFDQVPQIDLIRQIERHTREFQPTRVCMHAAHDTNIDHRIAHEASLTALRPVEGSSVRAIYAYEVLSSTEWNPVHPFRPQVFADITSSVDRKIRAMRTYEDEMRYPPHPRSEDVIRGLARYRGAQAGLAYAEAFQLIRGVDV